MATKEHKETYFLSAASYKAAKETNIIPAGYFSRSDGGSQFNEENDDSAPFTYLEDKFSLEGLNPYFYDANNSISIEY